MFKVLDYKESVLGKDLEGNKFSLNDKREIWVKINKNHVKFPNKSFYIGHLDYNDDFVKREGAANLHIKSDSFGLPVFVADYLKKRKTRFVKIVFHGKTYITSLDFFRKSSYSRTNFYKSWIPCIYLSRKGFEQNFLSFKEEKQSTIF